MFEKDKCIYADYEKNFAEMDQKTANEFWASLAIKHCAGLGIKRSIKIIRHYGCAITAYENRDTWHKIGIPPNIIREFNNGKWRINAKKEWLNAKNQNCNILLWSDCAYPRQLRELIDPPILLYFKGKLELLKSPCLGIVGSRNASERSLQIASSLAGSLSACGITIVSGMARGIDGCAHRAAIEKIGSSIGVLGTGIDGHYPHENYKLYDIMYQKGLILSEFAPATPPLSYNFPIRNRIISGLSLGIIVVEAAEKSGSLVTARLAIEQNREVFAVPGPVLNKRSQGCKNLVRNGAHLVFEVEDILQNLQYALQAHTFISPDADKNAVHKNLCGKDITQDDLCDNATIEAGKSVAKEFLAAEPAEQVLLYLRKNGIMQIDALAEAINMDVKELNSVIVFMEMLGQVKRLAGARFEANQ